MPFKKQLKKQNKDKNKDKAAKKVATNTTNPAVRQHKLTRKEKREMRKARRYSYTGSSRLYSNKLSYDELVNAESAIGRTIFGPIPAGHQREFFEFRRNIWIWHESYVDPSGVMQEMTVRYEVRPNGVYKRPGNGIYHKIEGVELDNFRKAARTYLELIKAKLYC